MTTFEAIVTDVKRLTPSLAHGFRLSQSDTEDLEQEAVLRIYRRLQTNDQLTQRLAATTAKRLAYVRTTLRNAAITLLRKKATAHRIELHLFHHLAPYEESIVTASERLDFEEICKRLHDKSGDHARFALDVFLGITTIQKHAFEHGRSKKTGQRWFALGVAALCSSIEQILGPEYEFNVAEKFFHDVRRIRQSFESWD